MHTESESHYEPVPLPEYNEYPQSEMLKRAREFLAIIRTRHTVRDFSARAVPREIIETCLHSAMTAPSGANLQPWHFAVIGNPKLKSRIRSEAENEERAFYEGKA